MKNEKEIFALTAENVDLASQKINDYLKKQKFGSEVVIKTCLGAESVLLQWLDSAAPGAEFELVIQERFGRVSLALGLKDRLINPFEAEEQEGDYYRELRSNLEVAHSYSYQNGKNIVDIRLPLKPVGNLGKTIIAIVAALVIGYAMQAVFPPEVNSFVGETYVKPLFKTIIGLLGTFASFMVFFSIIGSISGMGDVSTLKNIGSKYFKQVFCSILLYGALCVAVGCLAFDVVGADSGSAGNIIQKLYKLVIDVIPVNIVGAFYKGNMLQIVILALGIGSVLLMLGKEVENLNKQILQCNKLFQNLVRLICKLMPVFVFLSFLKMILSNSMGLALNAWKIIAMHNVCYLLLLVSIIVTASVFCRVPLVEHAKKCLQLYVMGFTTGNSIPCLPTSDKILRSYEVDEKIINFALPIGVSISRRTKVIYYIILVLGLCAMFGKSVGPGQLVVLWLSAVLLAFATPAVPGGGLAVITLLLEQYGLPLEAVGLAISLNFLDSMPSVAVKVVCTMNDVLVLARSLEKKQ